MLELTLNPHPSQIIPFDYNQSTYQVPCEDDAGSFDGAASVVTLSCAAIESGITIVANLIEHSGSQIFNTDVVLDENGQLVRSQFHFVRTTSSSSQTSLKRCCHTRVRLTGGQVQEAELVGGK